MHSLNLSNCGLSALPGAVGQLGGLRVLRLNHNKLTSLPPELGQLLELQVLSVNNNQLTTLPGKAMIVLALVQSCRSTRVVGGTKRQMLALAPLQRLPAMLGKLTIHAGSCLWGEPGAAQVKFL